MRSTGPEDFLAKILHSEVVTDARLLKEEATFHSEAKRLPTAADFSFGRWNVRISIGFIDFSQVSLRAWRQLKSNLLKFIVTWYDKYRRQLNWLF